MRAIPSLTSLAFLSLLAACGGVEREIEQTINAQYADQPVCKVYTRYGGGEVDFPIDIKSFDEKPSDDPILKGLAKLGMIEMDARSSDQIERLTIELTPKGQRFGVWSAAESGFCIGTRKVHEISSLAYGDTGEDTATVGYTWVLSNTPEWFKKDAFLDVPGVGEPESEQGWLKRDSVGWKILY